MIPNYNQNRHDDGKQYIRLHATNFANISIDAVSDWSQSNSQAEGYIKNKPKVYNQDQINVLIKKYVDQHGTGGQIWWVEPSDSSSSIDATW